MAQDRRGSRLLGSHLALPDRGGNSFLTPAEPTKRGHLRGYAPPVIEESSTLGCKLVRNEAETSQQHRSASLNL